MFSSPEKEIEKEIQEVLCRIARSEACACSVHEAKTELTPDEIRLLSPDLRKKWSTLSSPPTAQARRLEWSEARRCEASLRASLGRSARTSISHSRRGEYPIVFSAGIAHELSLHGVGGVGIDAELRTRTVTDVVSKRFTTFDEKRLGLEPIQIWVIKEALFKANPENQGTVLPHYHVKTFDSKTRTGTAQISAENGVHEFRFAWIDLSDWIVAVAVMVS